MTGIRERLALGHDGLRKVRSLLQDFTNSYRRRYVAPRDGLGRLEGREIPFQCLISRASLLFLFDLTWTLIFEFDVAWHSEKLG